MATFLIAICCYIAERGNIERGIEKSNINSWQKYLATEDESDEEPHLTDKF